MSGKHYQYVTETSDNGITLTLPKEIYDELIEKKYNLEYRKDRNSRLKGVDKYGKREYFGTLKQYVENALNIQIKDFADGNRLNFKRSNLILEK